MQQLDKPGVPALAPRLVGIVELLRQASVNSASVHRELATRLQKLVESLHPVPSAGQLPPGAAAARSEVAR